VDVAPSTFGVGSEIAANYTLTRTSHVARSTEHIATSHVGTFARRTWHVARREMLTTDFDFELPEDLIAQEAAPRGASRLLVLDRGRGSTQDAMVEDLPRFLQDGDVLVVNDTRVFAARLLGARVPTGGAVECLLLARPAQMEDGSAVCEALMHPGQKLKPGALVRFEGHDGVLAGEILEWRFFGRRLIRLTVEDGRLDVLSLVDALGHVPLPPYIRRSDAPPDRERYQTVYADVSGSVAAPTAGLHFTANILDDLGRRGVDRVAITLHVGYGTFKPVRTGTIEEHTVDAETYEVPAAAAERLNQARHDRRRIIAVGTTTTRALEDAAQRGAGRLTAGRAEATLFIYPGFRFQVIDGLMTNFHLPRSSLLMLVAAFAGRARILDAYRQAVERRYRFYSYGDAMLIL
jgi:S-adenosylmethionine:tRNA ribosyltransferase-isomerase